MTAFEEWRSTIVPLIDKAIAAEPQALVDSFAAGSHTLDDRELAGFFYVITALLIGIDTACAARGLNCPAPRWADHDEREEEKKRYQDIRGWARQYHEMTTMTIRTYVPHKYRLYDRETEEVYKWVPDKGWKKE